PECEDECEVSTASLIFAFDAQGKLDSIAYHGPSACPFVYAGGAAMPLREQGEILRNLSHPSLESAQGLTLRSSVPCGQPLRVRVAEEKRETTYLDSIAVSVGGHTVAPTTCSSAPAPPYCSDDGEYFVLAPGDMLDLEFVLPLGSESCTDPELR